MRTPTSITVAAGLLLPVAAMTTRSSPACANDLHVITVRGTSEFFGAGLTEALASNVTRHISDINVDSLVYPATLMDSTYIISVHEGVQALKTAVEDQVEACPDSRIAIIGFSQSMDALCGPGGNGFYTSVQAISPSLIEKNVVAVVLFGDPTHVVKAKYDRGTSVHDGVFRRSQSSVNTCGKYSDRLISFCDKGDRYCDAGDDMLVHSSYVARHGTEMVAYIVDKYKSATQTTGGTSSYTTSYANPTVVTSLLPSSVNTSLAPAPTGTLLTSSASPSASTAMYPPATGSGASNPSVPTTGVPISGSGGSFSTGVPSSLAMSSLFLLLCLLRLF